MENHTIIDQYGIRTNKIIISMDGKDESVGILIKALINTLVESGVIKREDFEDNLNAIKLLELLSKNSE